MRARASETQLELEEKLAQTVTEVTMLLLRLRGLTDQQRAALDEQVTAGLPHILEKLEND